MGRRPARALPGVAAILAVSACMSSYLMTPGPVPGRACPGAGGPEWYLPEAPADNDRLEDWCVTVGPALVREQPPGAFDVLRPGDVVTVLSWNVAAGGGELRRFLEREGGLRCDGPRSALAPEAGHFILLVQEAFRRSAEVPEAPDRGVIPRAVAEGDRPGARPDIVEVSEGCGLALVYVAAARNGARSDAGRREDRGVAILSTLPLSDVRFIELPYEAARRVAVAATVRDAEGGGVRLVNLHLTSASPPARTLVTGNGSRLRQGLAVADALRLMEEGARAEGNGDEAGVTTLLAGDFNTWSDNETTRLRLRHLFPDSPPPLDRPTRGAFPTDHILVREGPAGAPRALVGTYARLAERYHSDHHGIRIRVEFPR